MQPARGGGDEEVHAALEAACDRLDSAAETLRDSASALRELGARLHRPPRPSSTEDPLAVVRSLLDVLGALVPPAVAAARQHAVAPPGASDQAAGTAPPEGLPPPPGPVPPSAPSRLTSGFVQGGGDEPRRREASVEVSGTAVPLPGEQSPWAVPGPRLADLLAADAARRPAVSSFIDARAAERAVAEAIDANRETIDAWLVAPTRRNLRIRHRRAQPCGTVLSRGDWIRGATEPLPASSVVAVLRKDRNGGMPSVITAFCEP